MGCDIHCYLQKKNKDKNWRAIEEIELMRDYYLFGIINNVRREDFPPMAFGFIISDKSEQLNGYRAHKEYEATIVALPMREEEESAEDDYYLGEHRLCILDLKMMMAWKYWDKIEDAYTRDVLNTMLTRLLEYPRNAARYLIGFDD
jgi:glutathione S-transferase